MIVVSDASPIIALAAVGQLDLLRKLYGTILIPAAVRDELTVGDPPLPGGEEVQTTEWVRVLEVGGPSLAGALALELDRGEAEAIALAVEHDADLLLVDERRARKVAQRLGRPVMGVLGVLVAAKRQGVLPAVRPTLDDLLTKAGFRISETLRSRILEVSGEDD